MKRLRLVRIKITAGNRDDVEWLLRELETHFVADTTDILPSDRGGAHAFATIQRRDGE